MERDVIVLNFLLRLASEGWIEVGNIDLQDTSNTVFIPEARAVDRRLEKIERFYPETKGGS